MFGCLLERHERDDGSKRGGASLERATRRHVSHQHVGHLKAGRIEEQSSGKIYTIGRAMGVPLEAWIYEGEHHRRTKSLLLVFDGGVHSSVV